MLEAPTISELFKAKAITAEQVDAAVEAYLADPQTGPFVIAPGCLVDVTSAIEAHNPARAALADPATGEKFKRTMVRTAILLAGALPDAAAK